MKPRKCKYRAMLGKIGICVLHSIPCKEVSDTDCPNSDKYVNKFAEAVKKAMEDRDGGQGMTQEDLGLNKKSEDTK